MKEASYKKILTVFVVLYGLGMSCSMAGMEILSTLIVVSTLVYLAVLKWQRASIPRFSTGFDHVIAIYLITIVVVTLINPIIPAGKHLDSIDDSRWILNLYALILGLTLLRDKQDKIVLWFSGFMLIVGVYSIVQVFTGVDLFRASPYRPEQYGEMTIWRAKGFFSNTMSYSYSIGVLLCFLYASLVLKYFKGRKFLLVAATTAVLTAAFLGTFTRGAWISGFISFAAILMLWNFRASIKYLLALVGLVGVLALTISPIRDRISMIFHEPPTRHSMSIRKDLWTINVAMIKDHPFLGVGYGRNSKMAKEYGRKLFDRDIMGINAHSNILQFLAGSGIFVFSLWLLMCAFFFRMAWRLWQSKKDQSDWGAVVGLGSIGAQIFFHLGGLTQTTFFDLEPLHLFVFFWAMLVSQSIAAGIIPLRASRQTR